MILDSILLAFSELKANKMRSFLTMLGIVIGISAVIAIMTVGDALRSSTMDTLGGLGATKIYYYVIQKDQNDPYDDNNRQNDIRPMRSTDMFNDEIFRDLEDHFGDRVKGISLMMAQSTLNYKDDKRIVLYACNQCGFEETLSEGTMEFTHGRHISKSEFESGAKVIMISDETATAYYGSPEAAIGKPFEGIDSLTNKYDNFTVVGTYKKKSNGALMDMMVYVPTQISLIPLNSLQSIRLGEPLEMSEFTAIAKNADEVEEISKEMEDYLNNVYFSKNDTYKVYAETMTSTLDQINNITNMITLAISAIAAISLLVGGIGVMNIMVVSITERTREIGTRKALGATNKDIRMQFLIEAVVLCLVGSAIGILFGLLGGMAISNVIGFKGHASFSAIAGSVIFSMAFGVFFGYYPANKAAKMNPIDALRYE